MRKLIVLALGIYIGREVFLSIERVEEQKRKLAIRKRIESYIKENNPGMELEILQREVDGIMQK